MRTWSVALGLSLSIGLLLAPSLSLPIMAHICVPDPELGAVGTLLVPSGSGLGAISLDDRSVQSLPVLPSAGVVTQVARGPGGDRLAVARFGRAPNEPIGGSDILVTGPRGGPPLLTIGRERPGELLVAPTWLPNGGLVFERGSTSGSTGGGPSIERIEPDGTGRRVILERATAPAVSPDGALLAFIRSEKRDRLLVRPLDGGPERAVVDDPALLLLAFPRFAPDGSWIAFAAVSEPSAAGPEPGATGLGWLLPVARPPLAHGLPWDVWIVRPDGTDLRRVTYFYDDDPAVAWSPDGQQLAVFAGESIKLVAPHSLSTVCVLDRGGYGGFEWIDQV